MSDKIYKWLKIIATIILPATATLIITVFKIWNLPNGEMIAATITAVSCFLGSILQISSYSYARVERIKAEMTGKPESGADEVIIEMLKDKYNSMIRKLDHEIETGDNDEQMTAYLNTRLTAYKDILHDLENAADTEGI